VRLSIVVASDEVFVVRRNIHEELIVNGVVFIQLTEILFNEITTIYGIQGRLRCAPHVPYLQGKVIPRCDLVLIALTKLD